MFKVMVSSEEEKIENNEDEEEVNEVVNEGDSCPCGSGKAYDKCCGRL